MTDDEGLYTLIMHGEKHTYEIRGSEQHGLWYLCKTLSDITGFRSDYLRDKKLAGMRVDHEKRVDPANSIGTTPYFVVKRVA